MANETWITATFKGEDGSLGFKKGEKYEINLRTKCNGSVSIYHHRPEHLLDNQTCLYQSFRAFLLNWKDINITK